MGAADTRAALDAHDALVRACVDGELSFAQFMGAYSGFPKSFGLDSLEAPVSEAVDSKLRRRIAFHARLAQALSGLDSIDDRAGSLNGALAAFVPQLGLMRLRALCREHPSFEADSARLRR